MELNTYNMCVSSLGHKHILVIENDASIRDAFEMVLRDEHCIIHTCDIKNFTQVLDRWYPDIAIIDFPYSSFTPEIEKIIAILKQQAKNHVDILLMSTYKEIQLLAREIGMYDFLEKPFD